MRTVPIVASLALIAAPLTAMESPIVGPRALGMGGAGTACASDGEAAQHYNPAAFGFFGREGGDSSGLARRRVWGLGVGADGGLRFAGELGTYLDDLVHAQDAIDRLGTTGIQTPQDVQDLVTIGNALANVDNPGNAFAAFATAGVGVRIGHVGIGARGYAEAVGRVENLDTTNLGIADSGGGSLSQDIVNSGGTPAGSLVLLQGLNIGGGADQITPQAALILEQQAQEAGLTQAEAQQLVQLLNAAASQYGDPTDISDNRTTVTFRGVAVGEVPITYGRALSDHLAVGGSLKLLIGRVYGHSVLVFDEDAEDISSFADEYEQSVNVGLDLAVMARIPLLQVGLTARNVNAPSFDAPAGFDEVTLDPQLTFGAAFMPWSTFTIAGDIDLLAQESVLDGYDQQRLSFGVEWDIRRTLALRAGMYANLAESDIGAVYTAGIGLDLWAVRFDLAGAMSGDTVEFDGEDVPEEARVALRLASEW